MNPSPTKWGSQVIYNWAKNNAEPAKSQIEWQQVRTVPIPGIEPGSRWWERRILSTWPRGMESATSLCNVVLNNRSAIYERTTFFGKITFPQEPITPRKQKLRNGSSPCLSNHHDSTIWFHYLVRPCHKVQETVPEWDFFKELLNPYLVKTPLWDQKDFVATSQD